MWTKLYSKSFHRAPIIRSRTARWIVAALVCLGGWTGRAWSQGNFTQEVPRDAVEELRQALRQEDRSAPNEFQIEYREKNLDEKIKALKTFGELRRALALDEWKEEPGQGRDERLRQIDAKRRQVVGDRLMNDIRQMVAKGSPNSRLAVANMLAEIGAAIRALDIADRGGFARSLTPEVALLAQDADRAVRQQGLRALGAINPKVDQAIAVLRKAIRAPDGDDRALAGQGLAQLMRVTIQLRKRSQSSTRVEATDQEMLTLAGDVAATCQLGMGDTEPRVRIACLEALQLAAQGMADLIVEPVVRKTLPPEGRRLTKAEAEEILAVYDRIRGGVKSPAPFQPILGLVDLQPVFKKFQIHVPEVMPLLSDDHGSVRLAAITALESVAWTRFKEQRLRDSVPVPSGFKVEPILKEDALGAFLPRGLAAATRLLQDPDVRVRRMTLEFLENLGDSAAPAIQDLIDAMGDRDKFVRWAAARTLASLPANKTQAAVPALIRLLRDADLNVKQAAAGTLEAMGTGASPAAEALAKDLLDGDIEARTMVMAVIARLPAAKGKIAVPQLVELLNDSDSRLRKAAAETLGKIGPLAHDAIPALRRLVGDEEADVRTAASDAMLSILAGAK